MVVPSSTPIVRMVYANVPLDTAMTRKSKVASKVSVIIFTPKICLEQELEFASKRIMTDE